MRLDIARQLICEKLDCDLPAATIDHAIIDAGRSLWQPKTDADGKSIASRGDLRPELRYINFTAGTISPAMVNLPNDDTLNLVITGAVESLKDAAAQFIQLKANQEQNNADHD